MAPEGRVASVTELERRGALLVQDGNHGASRPLAHEIVEDGIAHIRAADIDDEGCIDFEGAQRVAESAWERIKKGRAHGGDVLLTHKGTVGRVATVPTTVERMLCSPQTTFWRSLDPEVLDQGYLSAFLRSELLQAQLRRVMHESDMAPYVSLTNQRGLLVTLPPVREQRAIAEIVSSLDDKIESNRRVAEAARRTLMHAALCDGSMAPLSGAASFRNGGALTKLADGTGSPILRIKELRSGVTSDTPRTDALVRPEHEVEFGQLLFSWSGTLLTCRWPGEPAVLNQHVFRVDPHRDYPTWLVEAWIEQHLPSFRQIAADKTTTMGHIQRHHLAEALVCVPDPDALAELDRSWTPLDQLRMGLIAEEQSLKSIRAGLLPKLVSGQIRVTASRDIADRVGATVGESA